VARPHPTATGAIGGLDPGVEIASADEPLAAFADRCDLVVVGATSAAVALVELGCPVAHVGDLDGFGFDSAGRVARGVLYGASRTATLDLAEMARFYAEPGWPERLAVERGSRARVAEAAAAADLRGWLRARLDAAASPPGRGR
jgi:hypothetical protein